MNTIELQKTADNGGIIDYNDDAAEARTLRNFRYYRIFIMDPPKKITLKKRICDFFEIPEELLFEKTRKREVVNARQVYKYLVKTVSEKLLEELKEKTEPHLQWMNNDEIYEYNKKLQRLTRNKTLSALGLHIGGRDHATVCHTMKAVQNYYDTETIIQNLIDTVTEELYRGKIELPTVE